MRWHRSTPEPPTVNQFILPDHVCQIPESTSYGTTSRCPKDFGAQPVGTRWICHCGRGWIVEPDLGLWKRSTDDDLAELIEP